MTSRLRRIHAPPRWLKGLGGTRGVPPARITVAHSILTELDHIALAMVVDAYAMYRSAEDELQMSSVVVRGLNGELCKNSSLGGRRQPMRHLQDRFGAVLARTAVLAAHDGRPKCSTQIPRDLQTCLRIAAR